MNIKQITIDSLRYPFTSSKLFILFLLNLGYFFIIPGIIAGGYVIRIIESTLEGSKELPEFTDLKKLLIDGLKYMVVGFIYGIPVLIVNSVIWELMANNPDTAMNITAIVSLILFFFIDIFLLMALANMVQEKTIKGAFQFKRIFYLIKCISWKKYLAYLIIFTIITTLLYQIIDLASSMIMFIDMEIIPTTQITMGVPEYSDAGIAYLLFVGIINTYLAAFTGRFIGLIYPRNNADVK
jgi:hypothetical protein